MKDSLEFPRIPRKDSWEFARIFRKIVTWEGWRDIGKRLKGIEGKGWSDIGKRLEGYRENAGGI